MFLTIGFSSSAQQNKAFDLMKDDIESMLPTLEAMIDSAIANNPFVKMKDLQINISEHKLKADRMQWIRNLGFQADLRYGTFDNFSTNTAEGQSPALMASRSNQLNYGAGTYIKIPFYDILNRKNQIKMDKTELEQAQNLYEGQKNELRILVIRQYNDLIAKHRILKIKSKYSETTRINMEMVEKEFTNGIVPVTEYARISEIFSRTQADFETSKMDFRTAYMVLEEMVGFKFNIANQ
jgi:outer membrane protein TolC